MASIQQRKSKDGKRKSYRAQVRIKGARSLSKTFRRKTDASKWVTETETAIYAGRYSKGIEAKRHTVGDVIDRYTSRELPKKPPKSQQVQAQQLRWWKNHIGSCPLIDLTPALIAKYRDVLALEDIGKGRRRSPATTVRYLAALSHAFSITIKEWGWLEDNPVRNVTKPKEPRGRTRFLSPDERDRLLCECKKSRNEFLHLIVVLALSTGMRASEIMNLTWKDIDLERRRIALFETKNGDIRSVTLAGHALALMKDFSHIQRPDTDLLFPGKRRNGRAKPVDIRSPWLFALKRAKIEDFRFHDLRHSCASYLAMDGATLIDIAEILGHKTFQMVKRYAHLTESHTSKVVERMNKNIFGTSD